MTAPSTMRPVESHLYKIEISFLGSLITATPLAVEASLGDQPIQRVMGRDNESCVIPDSHVTGQFALCLGLVPF